MALEFGTIGYNKGYKRLKSDQNLYTRHDGNHILILAVYVDDILIISNAVEHIKMAKEKLAAAFSITDGGPPQYMPISSSICMVG